MQKVDKKKRKKGKKFQKRAIHCTPKHITHDYYGSVRAHWTDKRWMVKEAVLRYAARVHGGNFSFKRCANGSTLSWLTLKRPYWGRRGMTDPSSMRLVNLGIERPDLSSEMAFGIISPSCFQKAGVKFQGGEIILPRGTEWQSREVKPRGAIWWEIFITLDWYFSLFGASYDLIFPVVLFTYFKTIPFPPKSSTLSIICMTWRTLLLKKASQGTGATGSLLPVFCIISVWHRIAVNASLFQMV